MRRFILVVLILTAVAFVAQAFLPSSNGAEPAASVPADVVPVPNVKQQSNNGVDESFGRRQPQNKDEGLKKLLDKDFQVPTPDVFAGFRVFLWGISVAGLLIGLTLAALVVVFTLKLIRKTAVPTVTGVPDASFAALKLFDNVVARIENRRKELEAEAAEIDKRMQPNGKTQRKSSGARVK